MVFADHFLRIYVGLVTLVDPRKTELHNGFLYGSILGNVFLGG